MSARFLSSVAVALISVTSPSLFAAGNRPVDIPERARGARSVVVAHTAEITPVWQTNEFGDLLIVSQVRLEVEETLKGAPVSSFWMNVEGGTLNGVTLRVSSLPAMEPGERGVFFVDEMPDGTRVPHGKGLGILKLDRSEQVQGTSLLLRDIRRMVQNAGR